MLALVICIAVVCSVSIASAATGRAVVVGINNYYGPSKLQYCVPDARQMEKSLREVGFTDIVTVLDRDASVRNVVSAVTKVGQRCKKDDVFVFYYSGHGAQWKDDDNDEADGYDEGLCLIDSQGNVQRWLDDDIEKTMAQIKSSSTVMILDCCHSGGSAKSFDNGRKARVYRGDTGFKPLGMVASAADTQRINYKIEGVDATDNPDHVVLAACRDGEQSFEISDIGHGVFTYYITQGMTSEWASVDTNKDSSLSYTEMFDYVSSRVAATMGGIQNPTCYIGSNANNRDMLPLPKAQAAPAPTAPDPPAHVSTPDDGSDIDHIIKNMVSSLEIAGKTSEPKYDLGVSLDRRSYNPGDHVTCTVDVDKPAYLYVLNVYYGGSIQLLYPNAYNLDNYVRIPSSFNLEQLMGNQRLEVQPSSRGGTEYFIMIASPVPLDFENHLPHKLSADYAFGEIIPDDLYSTRGAIADVMDIAYEGLKPLQAIQVSETATESYPSLNVEYVKFSVR
jgi:uncharacterized caspase-like protein